MLFGEVVREEMKYIKYSVCSHLIMFTSKKCYLYYKIDLKSQQSMVDNDDDDFVVVT